MKRQKLSALILAIAILLGSLTVYGANFRDARNHWSSAYINELSSKGIIGGYEDGTFRPNNNMTRAEFYKVINQLAKLDKTYTVSFSDIKKSDWYYNDVAKGIKAGYIVPTTGKLNPNRPITREEVIEIIGKVYELPERSTNLKFSDRNSISKNAVIYVPTLVDQGIISGYPNSTLGPKNNISRAEVAKILSTAMAKYSTPKGKVLSDSEIKFGPRNLYE